MEALTYVPVNVVCSASQNNFTPPF